MNSVESTCQKCGRPNVVWFAENGIFNKVNGSPNGILCPKCFSDMAEKIGIEITFYASTNPEIYSKNCLYKINRLESLVEKLKKKAKKKKKKRPTLINGKLPKGWNGEPLY